MLLRQQDVSGGVVPRRLKQAPVRQRYEMRDHPGPMDTVRRGCDLLHESVQPRDGQLGQATAEDLMVPGVQLPEVERVGQRWRYPAPVPGKRETELGLWDRGRCRRGLPQIVQEAVPRAWDVRVIR